MTEFGIYNNEDSLYDETPLNFETKNNEMYYNCSECSSSIEIESINEKNNIINFKCSNKESNHSKTFKMPLKKYLEEMKKYNNRKSNSDECEIHKKNNKYVSYCFNCNRHLCQECLKTRIHINHIKNEIIEMAPKNEELHIIKEIINDYKINFDNLMKKKENQLNEKLNEEIENENNNYKINIQKKNEDREKEELKLNKDNYLEDISKIIKKYKEEINLRKKKYISDNNKICNKYKLINEKEKIINNKKINELKRKFDKEIKNLKYNKEIQNMNNIKKLNEIVYNTYNIYNNNYYNAINIYKILLGYINNENINNKIKNKILNIKNDVISEIMQRKKKVDKANINHFENEIDNIKKEKEELLKSLSSNKIEDEDEDEMLCFKYKNEIQEYRDKIIKIKGNQYRELHRTAIEYNFNSEKIEEKKKMMKNDEYYLMIGEYESKVTKIISEIEKKSRNQENK